MLCWVSVALQPGHGVGSSESNISAHLAGLKGCGLVADPSGGLCYKVAFDRVFPLLEAAEWLLADVGQEVDLCPVDSPADDEE